MFNLEAILQSNNILFCNLNAKYNYFIDENSCSRIRKKERLYINYRDAQKVYYTLYEKMKQEQMPEEFMKKMQLRYLSEVEKTIRKLINVIQYDEFLLLVKELHKDKNTKEMLNEYLNSNDIYNIYVFLFYKIKFYKIYYIYAKIVELIKFYFKKYIKR